MRRLDNVPVSSLELYYACLFSQCFSRLQAVKKKRALGYKLSTRISEYRYGLVLLSPTSCGRQTRETKRLS